MSLIRPFKAVRPLPRFVSQIAAVPYDVVNRAEAFNLAEDNPLSFLHVSRPEIDLPQETNIYADQIYKMALTNYEKLTQGSSMIKEELPALYIYRLQVGDFMQTGIAGCFSLDEYDNNLIRKHEKTRKEKEDDRMRHVLALSSQTGPVFLTYHEIPEIDQYVKETVQTPPLYHFIASDEVIHSVWKIENFEILVNLFAKKIPALYIADGHHRAAAATRARAELAEKNPNHQGDENYNFLYGVAFPANQLKILPYHRIVKDLNGMSHNQFLERVENSYHIHIGDAQTPDRGEFGMYVGKKWYRIRARDNLTTGKLSVKLPNSLPSPLSVPLDAALLQDTLLGPILGINDPRTDKRIDFVGGSRGTAELERSVNSGEAVVAFSLHPTSLQDVMKVADSGGVMPPKSTWFEPKLRDGILSYPIL